MNVHETFNAAKDHLTHEKYEEAASLLLQLADDTSISPSIRVAAFHNLGCIRSAEGKPNTAALMLSSAVQIGKTEGNDDAVLSSLYLAGIQHLRLGHYQLAAECIATTLPAFKDKPALWHRLAECCIGVHKRQQRQHHNNNSNNNTLTTTKGSIPQNDSPSSLSAEEAAHVDAKHHTPRLDLSAAQLYLNKASQRLSSATDNVPQDEQEKDLLKQQIDLCQCYLHLESGDSEAALEVSQRLIDSSRNSKKTGSSSLAAAYNYAAEALQHLQRVNEARDLIEKGIEAMKGLEIEGNAALKACLEANKAVLETT